MVSAQSARFGFTLAEVLITLGIIGVVASLTIPSLINNYKEKELITRTKKTYSVIQNAILLAQVENGSVGDNTSLFDTSKTSVDVAKDFAKYFNGAKFCPDKNADGCGNFFYSLKFASKKSATGVNYPKIILPDNTIISVVQNSSCFRVANDCVQNAAGECIKDQNGNNIPTTSTHNDCATLFFDVNGTKLPNQFGRDAYSLKVLPNKLERGNWAPYGSASFKNIITGVDKLEYIKF